MTPEERLQHRKGPITLRGHLRPDRTTDQRLLEEDGSGQEGPDDRGSAAARHVGLPGARVGVRAVDLHPAVRAGERSEAERRVEVVRVAGHQGEPAEALEISERPVRPADAQEFTLRAVIVAMVVAAIIGGSYPYVVMKLGFGPNISVVSAFFGYLALGIAFRNFNRWENNIVQTAGTSAGMTAFLCVLMAAFDLLRQDPTLGFDLVLTPAQSFAWLLRP